MDFKAKGKIIYDPIAGKTFDAWWMIVKCPDNILDYYHYWIVKETGLRLNKPLFRSHISVIQGEEPTNNKQELWRKYHNEEVIFTYNHNVDNNGVYWWLKVQCEPLKKIRRELGLKDEAKFDFHLTIEKII